MVHYQHPRMYYSSTYRCYHLRSSLHVTVFAGNLWCTTYNSFTCFFHLQYLLSFVTIPAVCAYRTKHAGLGRQPIGRELTESQQQAASSVNIQSSHLLGAAATRLGSSSNNITSWSQVCMCCWYGWYIQLCCHTGTTDITDIAAARQSPADDHKPARMVLLHGQSAGDNNITDVLTDLHEQHSSDRQPLC